MLMSYVRSVPEKVLLKLGCCTTPPAAMLRMLSLKTSVLRKILPNTCVTGLGMKLSVGFEGLRNMS